MSLLGWLQYRALLLTTHPRRYANLFRTIYERRCRCLVEIGTWNGAHAEQMLRTAAARAPIQTVRYRGFDLFEDLTDELCTQEFSKRPPSREAVLERLQRTGADIRLFQGNTRTTLPLAVDELRQADFIFIDGGHSVETIASDWRVVESAMGRDATVVFDDYYTHDPHAPEGVGCQTIIDALDRSAYEVEVLDPTDTFRKDWGLLRVRMVRVRRR